MSALNQESRVIELFINCISTSTELKNGGTIHIEMFFTKTHLVAGSSSFSRLTCPLTKSSA